MKRWVVIVVRGIEATDVGAAKAAIRASVGVGPNGGTVTIEEWIFDEITGRSRILDTETAA